MLRLRPYVDADWEAVLDICLLAFAPACESLERLPGTQGSVVGVVHYEVDTDTQRGSIGVNAVHPARQGKGIGTLMHDHALDAMRAQGVKYATADAEGGASHAPARRVYEKLGFVAVPMVHYFKCLVTPEPADGGQERRAVGDERAAARPARFRNSSGSQGGPTRR